MSLYHLIDHHQRVHFDERKRSEAIQIALQWDPSEFRTRPPLLKEPSTFTLEVCICLGIAFVINALGDT
ncbi:hypothetical protein CR513_19686, partial [Mucuna pruriens]